MIDTAHGGLQLGNRRLDIEQYNGLHKPPTTQEEINGFPDQGKDVMESSTLEETEQNLREALELVLATNREIAEEALAESNLPIQKIAIAV